MANLAGSHPYTCVCYVDIVAIAPPERRYASLQTGGHRCKRSASLANGRSCKKAACRCAVAGGEGPQKKGRGGRTSTRNMHK
eukprot:1157262-Pelagomonas_calceolata.AAC.3